MRYRAYKVIIRRDANTISTIIKVEEDQEHTLGDRIDELMATKPTYELISVTFLGIKTDDSKSAQG